jgi:hypothetical protein
LVPSSGIGADNFLVNAPVNEAPVPINTAQADIMTNTGPVSTTAVNTAEINSAPIGVTCSVANVEAINSVVASAQTPQQAARLFAKIVSPAIGQAVANAVQQVLARTQNQSVSTSNQSSGNSLIQDWQLIIAQNGLAVELHWPSPGLSTAGNLPVALLVASAAPPVSGVSLPVTVSGTF